MRENTGPRVEVNWPRTEWSERYGSRVRNEGFKPVTQLCKTILPYVGSQEAEKLKPASNPQSLSDDIRTKIINKREKHFEAIRCLAKRFRLSPYPELHQSLEG